MAEDAQGERSSELPLLTMQDIGAAFPVRFPDFRCSVCGTDDFFSLENIDRVRQDLVQYNKVIESFSPSNLEMVEIACAECGYVYRFVEFLLLRSLNKARPDAVSKISKSGS